MAFSPSRGLLYTDPPADESGRRTRADADDAADEPAATTSSADGPETATPSAAELESDTEPTPTAADD